jgi:tetratricopeptide (TPR) repeat protein
MFRFASSMIACALCLAFQADAQDASPKPSYERLLQGEDAKQAATIQKKIDDFEAADDFAGAIQSAEELLALRVMRQGADHWEAVDAKWSLDIQRKIAASSVDSRAGWRKAVQGAVEANQLHAKGQYAKAQHLREDYCRWCEKVLGEKHPETASSYNYMGVNVNGQGKYADAQLLLQQALKLRRELLGEKHPATAGSYGNLASNLNAQGKYSDAQPFYQKALDLCRELFGEDDSETASRYGGLAYNLNAQAKFVEAEPLYRKALDIYRRVLGEDHTDTALGYNNLGRNLDAQGRYPDGQVLLQKALDIYRRVLGEDHPHTAMGYNNLASNLSDQGKYADAQLLNQKALDIHRRVLGEDHPLTATSYANLANAMELQAKHAEAEALIKKALKLRQRLLGEKHPTTALSYNNLAHNLDSQGKYAEAQPLFQQALGVWQLLLGEEHHLTATGYSNLASNLNAQGKYAEALPLCEKALGIRRRVLGEDHPDTASSYVHMATNLDGQGKFGESQALYQKAHDIYRRALGENHPHTALSYNNLAGNLNDQGKYGEAQPLYEKALNLHRELLGEKHPSTAICYNNVASNLSSQGKHAEAQPLYQKALDVTRELFGEHHPNTAIYYNNVASNLDARGKYADAQPLYQKVLDLRLELLGETHPDTAASYNNLGLNLTSQGKFSDGQPLLQKALDLRRKLLGENHPDTNNSYNNLATNLYDQGKHADAQVVLEGAVHCYEASRLSGAKGLDRATLKTFNPRLLLAALRAKANPQAAGLAIEMTLARGLLDQQAGRIVSSLPLKELADQAQWRTELTSVQSQILFLVVKSHRTDAENKRLDGLIHERQQIEERLAGLAVLASEREVASAEAIRAVLPTDAAILFWADVVDNAGHVQEHWGCILRSSGDPKWERLPGTGADDEWTEADTELPDKLRESLFGNGTSSEIATFAQQLYAQRLAPLAKHLTGVKTLYVVPVHAMAGIPVEVITTDYTISYIPSGTFLARLKDQVKPTGESLLALADPIFTQPGEQPKLAKALPPGGILITQVVTGGAGDQARLKADDVLLKYGDTELTDVDTLKEAIAANTTSKSIPVTVWRDDVEKPFVREVAPGKLGVVLDKDPAPVAIATRRQSDAMLLALRGGDWSELPGTRVEVSRIGHLFGANATILADSAASEQELEALRQRGDLTKYRYLHFATHGEGNDVRAFESSLILAQDSLPKDHLPRAGEPFINGQLSAAEVLESWKLNAELVTLSACETAVGREGGGDGPLGFAQAFLTAGSRAVCLSLWKVDDTATTLLMDRFYQNLLGKRPDLDQPLSKAAALAEAKTWLRNLASDEALNLTADITNGVVRGKGQKALPVLAVAKPSDPVAAKTAKPFDHPKYWAAFILIGDPN